MGLMAPPQTKGRDGHMTGIDYLEFELEIEHGSHPEYPVTVLNSPAGRGRDTMRFPFNDRELDRYLKDLQATSPRSGRRPSTDPSTQEPTIQEFGRKLFDALFDGTVGVLYDACRHQATQEAKALRLKLHIRPPEMAALPWELLHDSHLGEYVCLSHITSVIRFVETDQRFDLPTVTPPLRILGLIASPDDRPAVDVEREKQRIEEATEPLQVHELVELTWLERQTWRDLQQAVWSGPWHVFHFVGHGGLDRNTGEGFIDLVGDDGRSFHLGTSHLSWLLASHEPLRLVWLNGSGGPQGDERDRFSSVATDLVRRGIPAVLTMQHAMTERAAVEFIQVFYAALATPMSVDLAVVRARAAVNREVPGTVEWGVPALYSHLPDLHLFDSETLVTTATQRGSEALAKDEFERAVVQYTLAVEMGADTAVQEKRELAAEVGQKLAAVRDALGELAGSTEAQADAVIHVFDELADIEPRLPGSQAIQRELVRAREKASSLRDHLWERGQQLVRRSSAGLTVDLRRRRLQTGIRLLEKAIQLDAEDMPALREDLAAAERRLSHLQRVQPRTESNWGRRLRTYGLIGAAVACALLIVFLATDLVPISSLIAKATPTTTGAPTHTAMPTLAAEAATTTPAPSRTEGLTPLSTQAGTSTPDHTASPVPTQPALAVPSHTSTNTPALPIPSLTREPTATPAWTATLAPPPTETATATPRPARPRPSPTSLPTATPSPGIVYAAPVLLEPEDIAYLSQDALGTYRLSWSWDGTLQSDEWFDVRIWQAGMPHYGIAWTKQPEYVYDICVRGSGDFYWTVAVIRGVQGQWLADLSPEAEPHRFTTSRYDSWCTRRGRDIIPPGPRP
jgi:hypothetical protein